MTVAVLKSDQSDTLGLSVPPYTAHAISVSLPTWRDNVGYEEGEKRVLDAMTTGYPRFFIHQSIQKLARVCERRFGTPYERCMLFPTRKIVLALRSFMENHSPKPLNLRLVDFSVGGDTGDPNGSKDLTTPLELHIAFFPADCFPLAKQFWQHTGLGISSRYAERCLAFVSEPTTPTKDGSSPPWRKPSNRHYSVKATLSPPRSPPPSSSNTNDDISVEQGVYMEERYGRNFPVSSSASAKRALRRRIADVLQDDGQESCAGASDTPLAPSLRGVEVTENEVFLYPSGMSAIWSAHQLVSAARGSAKSVCFGFPYTDTLKILQKWGPGCYFFGHGLDSDIDALEKLLEEISSQQPRSSPPILSLFCEFPSNPLLRSPNLSRLRQLADKHDFLIVIDETLGSFVNVSVLPFADIVVSSLSKIFSGDANVMGGSLVLNQRSKHFSKLKSILADTYEDTFFSEDAVFMERNSRNFKKRVHRINVNAEAVCDYLHARSPAVGGGDVIKSVFYPKFTTRGNFDLCKHKGFGPDVPNFGGLFSVTFRTKEASVAFYDSLHCYKGPSLGTNFTLACPFTVLAHYTELDWANQYGVEEGLVRVSVGLEETKSLVQVFASALEAAERACGKRL